jgi:pimeloyl-ACP methyl ester carboxylesterase
MPYLTIENQPIFFAYREGRTSSETSLLLIHGAGGSHLDWPPEIRNMPMANVYALDLPGHGRSDPPGYSSIDEYAAYIAAFIEAINTENIILVGHSMGGAIVQKISLTPPSQVVGMVLIASGARLRVAPAILEGVVPEFEKTADIITDFAWSEDSSDRLRQYGKANLLKCDPSTVHGDFLACNGFDMMEDLGKIQLPSLVVCGIEDQMTPIKYSHYIAEQLPFARMEPIEGAGHMVMLEQPEIVSEAIELFVREVAGL